MNFDVKSPLNSMTKSLLDTLEIETLNAIKEHYWWPIMQTFIKNYVKGCGICQQFKINQNPSNPSYIPIPGPAVRHELCFK